METCAQISQIRANKRLENAIISTILNNVNTGICFYQTKPSQAMRLSLEETIIENLPFAELVAAECKAGVFVLEKLTQLYNDVINKIHVHTIALPEA